MNNLCDKMLYFSISELCEIFHQKCIRDAELVSVLKL